MLPDRIAMTTKKIAILLIEDNPAEARLFKELLDETEWEGQIHTVDDGEKALAFLRREGEYKTAPPVNLVLLDLHLPRYDGWEILKFIKGDERLRRIPVVVFTSSAREEDVAKAYELQANCYLVKPLTAEDLAAVISSFREFWFKTARLPQEEEGEG